MLRCRILLIVSAIVLLLVPWYAAVSSEHTGARPALSGSVLSNHVISGTSGTGKAIADSLGGHDYGVPSTGPLRVVLLKEVRFDPDTRHLTLHTCGITATGSLTYRNQYLPPQHYFVTSRHYWFEPEGRYRRDYFYICYQDSRGNQFILGELLRIEFYSLFVQPCYAARLDIPWRFNLETQEFELDFQPEELDLLPPPYQGNTPPPVSSMRKRQRTEELLYRAVHGDEEARMILEENGSDDRW